MLTNDHGYSKQQFVLYMPYVVRIRSAIRETAELLVITVTTVSISNNFHNFSMHRL